MNGMSWLYDTAGSARREDASIHLALTRIRIDQGRFAAAADELGIADALLDDDELAYRMERDVLQSRLDISQGDVEAAYRRLRRTLRMISSDRAETWRTTMWRVRLGSEPLALTEAYGWMAIAAFETGNREDATWALQEARNRGVDVRALADRLRP